MAWLALLLACAPGAAENRAYADALAPVLLENGLLADQLLILAGAVHDDRVNSSLLTTRWSEEIVVLAERVAIEAAAVPAPPAWRADHASLLAAWKGRAGALRDGASALADGDRAGWESARAAATRAQLDEEAWFRAANDRLGPSGMHLNPHP